MPGRQVRVQCREPKTGQETVQFYCEDDSLFLSSYYLSMVSRDKIHYFHQRELLELRVTYSTVQLCGYISVCTVDVVGLEGYLK